MKKIVLVLLGLLAVSTTGRSYQPKKSYARAADFDYDFDQDYEQVAVRSKPADFPVRRSYDLDYDLDQDMDEDADSDCDSNWDEEEDFAVQTTPKFDADMDYDLDEMDFDEDADEEDDLMVMDSGKDAGDFFNGFAKGVIGSDVGDMSRCVTGTSMISQMEAAIQDFNSKNPMRIASGITKVFGSIAQVGNVIQNCAGVSKDAASKLIRMAMTFRNPAMVIPKVTKNFLFNSVGTVRGIIAGVNDINAHNFYGGGKHIGEVSYNLLK